MSRKSGVVTSNTDPREVLCPAVFVKTRVCRGLSVPRASKTSLRSMLFCHSNYLLTLSTGRRSRSMTRHGHRSFRESFSRTALSIYPWYQRFFSCATGSFVSSAEGRRHGHFLRLDRDRKPRMKSLWHPGYFQFQWSLRNGPLEKLLGGRGIFEPQEFFFVIKFLV